MLRAAPYISFAMFAIFGIGRLAMVQILTVSNGTTLLRPGIGALHSDGYRVTMYNVASVRDLRYAAPDLLIVGADSPRAIFTLLTSIRADTVLHDLPIIVIGASWDVFAPLPVALLTDTILLPDSFDERALQDATRMFVPTPVRARSAVHHAPAVAS